MKVDEEFVRQYKYLIRDRIRAAGVGKRNVDELESLVYERLLGHMTWDESRGKFTTWLGWVVRSVVWNWRKKKERSEDIMDADLLPLHEVNVIGAEDAGDAKDELERIFTAAELTRRDEGIMRAVYLEGLTYEEAAEEFGLGFEAVKKVITKSMKALRKVAG